jgi:hypothetical protein
LALEPALVRSERSDRGVTVPRAMVDEVLQRKSSESR